MASPLPTTIHEDVTPETASVLERIAALMRGKVFSPRVKLLDLKDVCEATGLGGPVGGIGSQILTAFGFARGGLVHGPGNATSDSILARVSSGEYVIPADAVRAWGSGVFDALSQRRLPAFSGGGMVGSAPVRSLAAGPSIVFNSAPIAISVPASALGDRDRMVRDVQRAARTGQVQAVGEFARRVEKAIGRIGA